MEDQEDDEEYSEESKVESEEEEEENWSDEESPVKKKAKSVKKKVVASTAPKMSTRVIASPKVDLIDLTTCDVEDRWDDRNRPARVSVSPTSLVAQKQSKDKAMS